MSAIMRQLRARGRGRPRPRGNDSAGLELALREGTAILPRSVVTSAAPYVCVQNFCTRVVHGERRDLQAG